MRNQELFNRTIDILVKAYQNDTLVYSDCAACALGNMIAANNGIRLIREADFVFISPASNDMVCGVKYDYWHMAVWVATGKLCANASIDYINVLETTGYTAKQCAEIELSFYTGVCYDPNDELDGADNTFQGLMSVVDTLMTIHEATETEATEAKEMFVKLTA